MARERETRYHYIVSHKSKETIDKTRQQGKQRECWDMWKDLLVAGNLRRRRSFIDQNNMKNEEHTSPVFLNKRNRLYDYTNKST